MGTLRNHDGHPARPFGRYYGHDYGHHGSGWTTRCLLPEPALARQASHGYPNGHEEPDRRQRANSERDGEVESDGLTEWRAGVLAREISETRGYLVSSRETHIASRNA